MEDFRINFSVYQEKQQFYNYLKTLKGPHVIHVNSFKGQRKLPLNNYYWGVVLEYIAAYTGYSVDELHDIFVEELLPLVVFRNYQNLSSTDCTDEEMWKFCMKIRHWFKKFTSTDTFPGIEIPDPFSVLRPDHQPCPDIDINQFENHDT